MLLPISWRIFPLCQFSDDAGNIFAVFVGEAPFTDATAAFHNGPCVSHAHIKRSGNLTAQMKQKPITGHTASPLLQ